MKYLLFIILLFTSSCASSKDFAERRSLMLLCNEEIGTSKNRHYHIPKRPTGRNSLKKPFNGVSVLFAPSDAAFGIRYEHGFGNSGVYGSISTGAYHFGQNTMDHVKVSAGSIWYVKPYSKVFQNTFSAGLNIHTYGGNEYFKKGLYPVSFDLGTGAIIGKRILTGFDFDVIKQEVQVRFGIKF
jgi:hypothetical protein